MSRVIRTPFLTVNRRKRKKCKKAKKVSQHELKLIFSISYELSTFVNSSLNHQTGPKATGSCDQRQTTIFPGISSIPLRPYNLAEKLKTETFDILHLATHGEFSSDPNRTFVMLNDVPLYADDLDELLRLNDNLQSPLEMIVLSACQTAAGDSRATLGLAGLTIRAGAQSALATLWPVEDQSAAILMQEFYRQIATHRNISRAEALRRSQLKLWEEDADHRKDWEAQSFWAPYVLVGNWL